MCKREHLQQASFLSSNRLRLKNLSQPIAKAWNYAKQVDAGTPLRLIAVMTRIKKIDFVIAV